MKINLSQALRLQKRTKELIAKLTSLIKSGNSIERGSVRDIDILEGMELRKKMKAYLIDLKYKVMEASLPIQRYVLQVSEYKDDIMFYKNLETRHGKVTERNRFDEDKAITYFYEAEIRRGTVEKQCLKCQKLIDELYSKIDTFNVKTLIEVEDSPGEQFEDVLMEIDMEQELDRSL